MKITWKKGFFSSNYELISNHSTIGELRESFLSNTTHASINQTDIKFKKRGLFTTGTDIIDEENNEVIGHISFNTWRNKAKIELDEETYHLKYDNFWYSRWTISHYETPLINYKSSSTSGEINSLSEKEALILAGLYVHNYYLSILIVITVVVVIISSS